MLPNLESTIKLDSENKELKETYDKCKQNLELIDLFRFYLTEKDNPIKENMVKDLMKIDYKPDEAEEIAIMFFSEINKRE